MGCCFSSENQEDFRSLASSPQDHEILTRLESNQEKTLVLVESLQRTVAEIQQNNIHRSEKQNQAYSISNHDVKSPEAKDSKDQSPGASRFSQIVRHVRIPSSPLGPKTQKLRVGSWNIKNLGYFKEGRYKGRYAPMLQMIQQLNCDILLVQEVIKCPVELDAKGKIDTYEKEYLDFVRSVCESGPRKYLYESSYGKTGYQDHLNGVDTQAEYYGVFYDPMIVNTNDGVGKGYIHENPGTDTPDHTYPGDRVPYIFPFRLNHGKRSHCFHLIVVHFYCQKDGEGVDSARAKRNLEVQYVKNFIQTADEHFLKTKSSRNHFLVIGDMNFGRTNGRYDEIGETNRVLQSSGFSVANEAGTTPAKKKHPYDNCLHSHNLPLEFCDMNEIIRLITSMGINDFSTVSDHYPVYLEIEIDKLEANKVLAF